MFQIHEDLNSYSRNKTDCRRTYIGVKRVYAERHTKGDKPGYKVIYEDGYESWSPKDVFEAAYFPIEEDNRLSPDDIDAFLNAGSIGVEKRGDKSTLVEVTFPTGWRDYEVSSCVDPANYDEELGKKYALENIKRRLWNSLGFVLQWAHSGLTSRTK